MNKRILMTFCFTFGVGAMISLLNPTPADARIKLATLPDREAVVVRFDNPNVVMVEEERTISLQKGVNNVDFSWAGTQIDKGSIIFRPADPAAKVEILSTSYPPGEAALTWQISAAEAMSVKFRLSYLMANIQRETDYRMLVSKDEQTCSFKHYFKIRNWSGGRFATADFVTRDGKKFEKGLENGEAKRVLVNSWDKVKLTKEYVYDLTRQPEGKVLTDYVLKNAKEIGLGSIPLEYGKVRIYQDDGSGTTAFTGEDWGRFTPIGDDMRLNIGIAQDIKIEMKKMVNDVQNRRGNVYDTDEVDEYEIKNFKDTEAVVTLVLRVDGEWEMKATTSGHDSFERVDNETIRFKVKAPAKGTPVKLRFHYQKKNVW
ncbi:MAG: hypothetical protein HS108_01240 [Planctomycetes bacterium]|jgi:hypothetical protein|nr:hypothetical protein [Planctomycetota bacterium]MCL4729727.1 hypothetical protein [Planctomycetota bacterium]